MTVRYVGSGGNDGNSGLTWALRKLTLNGAEDTPVVAGDVVYVGPGVYRELLTCDVSGANTYQVGTVSVTNGSKTVTGAGTTFGGNVAADYMFHIAKYASGNDGVANGTATFTSAAGNFQANMVGKIIQINTRGAYKIGAVAGVTSITLVDVNGLGWPAAAGGLTYSVMSGEGHYDIESQDNNTQLTLEQSWNGPTLTGLVYITFNPIRYIADVTGENTDSVGGVVRVTGSDNDQAATRADCIVANTKSYRVFRGFRLDLPTGDWIDGVDCTHWIVEDCYLEANDSVAGIYIRGASQANWTIRRVRFFFTEPNSRPVYVSHSATVDDVGHLIENCILLVGHGGRGVEIVRVGGVTIRNCTFSIFSWGVRVATALAVGQATVVNNCSFCSGNVGLQATVLGEIVENYNSFFSTVTDRSNVGIGANSLTYPSLFRTVILHAGADQISGFKFPWGFGELSEWSRLGAIAGAFEAYCDLHGIPRPATASKSSWGSHQFADAERDTGTVHGGSASIKLADAGRIQIKVPVTATSTTISVYVYREANYAGDNPQMIVKQPGQADDITTEANAASQWNLLTTTLTPAASPPYVIVELVSRNTAVAGNYDTFFDDLEVS